MFRLTLTHQQTTVLFAFILASPKIAWSRPAPILEDEIRCSATGTFPIYVALIWNSTVLINTTTIAEIQLTEKGNYSCVATNMYGTDKEVISPIILGKNLH